jgi:hypothetical protein
LKFQFEFVESVILETMPILSGIQFLELNNRLVALINLRNGELGVGNLIAIYKVGYTAMVHAPNNRNR